MAGILDGSGPPYGVTVPYGSHQGLILRAVGCPDEVRLQIDLAYGDLDHEVGGLPGQVHHLRNVDREARNHSHTANQLNQVTAINVRLICPSKWECLRGSANTRWCEIKCPDEKLGEEHVRTLNRIIVPYGSAHAIRVIVYALICFFLIYLWYKLSG